MTQHLIATAGQSLGTLDAATDRWLGRLTERMTVADHVVGALEEQARPLRRLPDGRWAVGGVVGELWFDERRLRICLTDDERCADRQPGSVAAPYAAAVWCRGFEAATRHGPPAIRTDVSHVGPSLRGRLDVRGTARLRGRGSSAIASVYRARDMGNDISRALVAAERTLTRQLGHDRWHTRRVTEVLPQIQEAVGRRAGVPSMADLSHIRYSPITRPFRSVAELSVRIVMQDPVTTTVERGRPQGLVVELSEALATAQTMPALTA